MRFSLPNSRIMVHQPSGGFQGQATDIMLHAQDILNLKKRLNEIYVKHTGQTFKAIEDALERDKFLTAEDGPGLRHCRQGDRQARRRAGRGEDPVSSTGSRRRGSVGSPASWPVATARCGPILPASWAESSAFVPVRQRGNRATLRPISAGLTRAKAQITVLSRVFGARPISEFLIVGCHHGWLGRIGYDRGRFELVAIRAASGT